VKKKVHEHQIHCWKEKIGPLFAINCEGWPLLNRPAMRTVKKKVKIYKNKRSSFRVSGCLKTTFCLAISAALLANPIIQ
jgi:hypothetical protein